jgi:hypothetical protein
MSEPTGDWRNLDVIKSVGARLQCPHLARYLCLFAPFWVRSPQTWNPSGETPLLDHLFVLHHVPGFLYPEWFRELEFPRLKWLYWFILLGQGGSLKRAA